MSSVDRILKKPAAKLKPLYLVYSENDYLLKDFQQKFQQAHLQNKLNDFNYSLLEAGDDFAIKLKNQANTPPFMAEKRFIIAKTREHFTKKTEEDHLLISLFNNFPATTVLIILVEGKVKKNLKTVKKAEEIGELMELALPKYQELDNWILAQFQARGKEIEHGAIKFLEDMFQNNLYYLSNEIEKIILFAAEKKRIQLADIKEIISKDRLLQERVVFALTDALIKRQKGKALQILNEMISNGAQILQILGTIVWQLKLLLSVKDLKKEGKGISEIARVLQTHKYPVQKCYQEVDNFTEEELEILLERFLEANLNVIQGKYEDKLALEMAIMQL